MRAARHSVAIVTAFAISVHAAQRWIERVEPTASRATARAAIRSHARAIEAAIELGCRCVRLPCGARIVIAPASAEVVTILAAEPKRMRRRGAYSATRGYSLKGAKKHVEG